jgi:hypothetical protein
MLRKFEKKMSQINLSFLNGFLKSLRRKFENDSIGKIRMDSTGNLCISWASEGTTNYVMVLIDYDGTLSAANLAGNGVVIYGEDFELFK